MWFQHVLYFVFGIDRNLGPENADDIYDRIAELLARPEFRVRSLYDRFNIEVLTTTDSPLDDLQHHRSIADSGWSGRVIPAYRPDPVVDPEFEGFTANVARLGEITGKDTHTWPGYLAALAERRQFFKSMGAVSTDHGHPSAVTADLDDSECRRLFAGALEGQLGPREAELFRGQMLTEMVRMSLDDGLVIQLHPGAFRNHNPVIFHGFGRDKGADIPVRTEYVQALKPLLDRFGNDPNLTVILFTLDESTYSRELAPLAGHYPMLKTRAGLVVLRQSRRNDAVQAPGIRNRGFLQHGRFQRRYPGHFLSIPARHDMARRIDCAYLAELVGQHRLDEGEASEVAVDLAYRLGETGLQTLARFMSNPGQQPFPGLGGTETSGAVIYECEATARNPHTP